MTFYLLLVAVLALLALILQPMSTPFSRRTFALSAFVILGVLASIRTCDVGADTHQYCTYYPIIGSMGWGDAGALRYEPGFFLLNKVLNLISPNPQILIAVTSLIIIAGIGRYIYRSSVDILMGVSLFILLQGYAMVMTAMRQSLATAIALAFVHRLEQRKPIGFIAAVLVASQFHSSALVMLVLVPLSWLKFGRAAVAIVTASSLLLWWLSGPLFALVVERTGLYSDYLEGISTSGGKLGVLLEAGFFLVCLAIMGVARYLRDGSSPESQASFIHLAAWMVLPASALAYGSNAYLRLTFYFVPMLATGIAASTSTIRSRRDTQLIKGAVWVVSLAYFIALSYLRPEWFRVIPYESILA